jgi:DNA-binding GntR family transcriptional regulator
MSNPDGGGAAQRIYLAIQDDVDQGRLVPGQRLVEADLTARFAVGRNAVREAMQRLEGRGIVDLSRHRSATIRRLSLQEALDILDVAEAMMVLLGRAAAAKFGAPHRAAVEQLLADLAAFESDGTSRRSADVRRDFYRTMLTIADNHELERLLPTIGTHILYAQYRSRQLQLLRARDYRAILEAVVSQRADAAAEASRAHVAQVRSIIRAIDGDRG